MSNYLTDITKIGALRNHSPGLCKQLACVSQSEHLETLSDSLSVIHFTCSGFAGIGFSDISLESGQKVEVMRGDIIQWPSLKKVSNMANVAYNSCIKLASFYFFTKYFPFT